MLGAKNRLLTVVLFLGGDCSLIVLISPAQSALSQYATAHSRTKMDDPNIILTLSPADEYGLAADAIRLPHNRARYVPPSAALDDGPSRETTPAAGWSGRTLDCLHRIILTFDQEVKVPGRVSFGTDPNLCDVLLASKRGQYNISHLHFYITFDAQRRPTLNDCSTNGTAVGYDGQAEDERRNHFRWIFFEGFEKTTVKLHKQGLGFNVHLPNHDDDTCKMNYNQNVDRVMANAPPGLLAMGSIQLHEPSVSSSAVLASNQEPVYIYLYELGRGAFGKVYRVINASTGDESAGKEFFYKTGWKREIEIMQRLHHVFALTSPFPW